MQLAVKSLIIIPKLHFKLFDICLIDLVTSHSCLLLTLTVCRKMLVPLPLGLVHLGRYYQFLTSFCFVSMGHGVKLGR